MFWGNWKKSCFPSTLPQSFQTVIQILHYYLLVAPGLPQERFLLFILTMKQVSSFRSESQTKQILSIYFPVSIKEPFYLFRDYFSVIKLSFWNLFHHTIIDKWEKKKIPLRQHQNKSWTQSAISGFLSRLANQVQMNAPQRSWVTLNMGSLLSAGTF